MAIKTSSVDIHDCGFTTAHYYSSSFTLPRADPPLKDSWQLKNLLIQVEYTVETSGLEGSDKLVH